MPTISAVTTCKGRLEHLKQTLPTWMAVSGLEVVVVDYDCPDGAGDWVEANHPAAKVVRVKDQPIFNRCIARNLGAAAATGEWLVFLDADVSIAPDFLDVIEPLLRPGVCLIPDPRPADVWGCMVVRHIAFDRVGGYDEVFEGWGSEDVDLGERLMLHGSGEEPFPGRLLTSIPHGEDLRTRFQEIADLDLGSGINAFYRLVKNDLLRHGVLLDLERRRSLRADIVRAFTTPGGGRNFQVSYGNLPLDAIVVTPWLRYDITWRNRK